MPTTALVRDWKKPISEEAVPAERGKGVSAPAMACGPARAKQNM